MRRRNVARLVVLGLSALGHSQAAAQPAVANQPPAERLLDRPVGATLHPSQVFLDVAWERTRADPAAEKQLLEEAFAAAQIAQRSASGSSITQMVIRLSEGDTAFSKSLRDRQATADQVEALRQRLSDAARSGDAADLKAAAPELDRLLRRLREQEEALSAQYASYAGLIQERPVKLSALQAQIRPSEAILFYADGDKASYVFLISRNASRWVRLRSRASEVEKHVEALRCQMEIPTCGGDGAATSFDRTRAFELYRVLIEPVGELLVDKKSLTIIPSRSLSRFPFAALVTSETSSTADSDPQALRDTPWLINRFALTTVPTASALYYLRTSSRPKRPTTRRSFRGFGAPTLDQPGEWRSMRAGGGPVTLTRGSHIEVDPTTLKTMFDDLPFTAAELEALRVAFKAPTESIVTGQDATETALKEAPLEQVDVLALATHGVLGGELPGVMEPALIFTPPASVATEDDGILTASEAAKLNLNADLVILSACNTAGPGGFEGPSLEGLSGLARSFFVAGARSLLVSHWRVFDDVAAALTVATVNNLDLPREAPKAVALQRAIIAVRGRKDRSWSHPSAWAPLAVVGDDS